MRRVHEWLESLAAEEPEGRPTKRLCRGLDQPPSPPLTLMMSDASRGRKRFSNRPSLPCQSKRPKSGSPKKTKSILEELDKPFKFQSLPIISSLAIKRLPKDVQSLYTQIYDANEKEGIFPSVLRAEMTALYKAHSTAFKKEKDETMARAEAIHVYNTLCNIIQRASEAITYERHEGFWNSEVHTPLLGLIFTSRILDVKSIFDSSCPPCTQNVSVRYEIMTAATIAPDALPSQSNGIDVLSSLDGTESNNQSQTDISRVSNSGNHKRVDYVLVMDIDEKVSLYKTLSDVVDSADCCCGVSHINQTFYRPVRKSLIAVSIETKPEVPQSNPLLQLGIWTAAWHTRMYTLRPSASLDPGARLVSLPLIQTVGYLWQIYFACDMDSYIDLYGPMTIGSTENIASIYALLSSLQSIKAWIETTFQDAMTKWFDVELDSPVILGKGGQSIMSKA
ncbi:hypothetical protein F5Y07DRAFT_382955 [Xylaria sp. FL0933]|nr:hypothetical protein F5Y07DRAFT_382955 [Xylaria sp. FL0933]